MKFKQKCKQLKLMFSEDSPPVVSKQREPTSNSTVLSQVSTKSETHGQTHTKTCCNSCGVKLTEETWSAGNARKAVYICRLCDSIKRKRNKLREKARSLGIDTLLNYNKVKQGSVYIMGNPAWPEWVKVGMAIDSEDRLSNYQTSCPQRDYVLYYSYDTEDRRKAESAAHYKLGQQFERKNEWFKCSPEEAIEVLNENN